jgi:Tfp pilus assembly protein FimT
LQKWQCDKRGKQVKFVRLKQLQFIGGFTMAEVMIVVLIMGIVTLVGLPLLSNSMNHYLLKGAAEELVNSLQYARSSAMNSGRKTMVEHNISSNKIRVFQFETQADLVMGGDELAAANVETGSYQLMEHPLKKGENYQVILHNQFKGVLMTLTDFAETDPVYFDMLGIPSHGGSTTLALGGQQIVVTLDALTGKASTSD